MARDVLRGSVCVCECSQGVEVLINCKSFGECVFSSSRKAATVLSAGGENVLRGGKKNGVGFTVGI